MCHAVTFDFVSQLATLVLGVVDNGRRGWWPQAILLHLAPVPLLSGQHALAALPLVQVVSGLGEVHVQTARVFFVCTGSQTDTIPCADKSVEINETRRRQKNKGGKGMRKSNKEKQMAQQGTYKLK